MSQLVRLPEPKYYTRQVQLRADQGNGVSRTVLARRWKILTPGITAILKINGIEISPDYITGLDGVNFDLADIRKQLRELIPMSPEENNLCRAEATLFGTQLLATEYYRYMPTKFLFDCVFTGELCVTFKVISQNGQIPDIIEMDEESVISEIQLMQRLRNGESLEDIDKNNRLEGQAVALSVNNVSDRNHN